MNYKRFLEITRSYWNNYLTKVANAASLGMLDSQGKQMLFPTILLFTKTKYHFVAELIGASENYNGLIEKSHNEPSINRYLNQFDTNRGDSLLNLRGNGVIFKDLCLSREVELDEVKSRFPFADKHLSTLILGENHSGSPISFIRDFKCAIVDNCTIINTNLVFFRVKSILNLIVVQDSILASQYELQLKNYLNGDYTAKGIHACDFGKAEDLALASQFANTYLLYGIRETTIGEFLNLHSKIIARGLGTKKFIYEPYLKWIEAKPENTDNAINPDLMIERDDGFYDIYDLKTALLNKPSITKSERKRRRFIDYVEDGVAQLANYLEYFDYSKNCEHAFEKYGIKVKNPNLVLVVGNYENTNKIEIEEASRRFKDLTIIDYDSFLQLFLLSNN